MRSTLTIRADASLRKALARRAEAEGKTVSQLVRELLEEAMTARPIETRAGHLKGKLELSTDLDSSWRSQLRKRNWRS